ncbi:MAG: hypothetical protein M3R02_11680 [Chloroflexota bacterium]|nr:hypothetical protein [Chloroflexota bacterium]
MRRLFVLGAVALAIVFGGISLGVAQDQEVVEEEAATGCLASFEASPFASPEGTPAVFTEASPDASPGVSPFASPVASPEAFEVCASPEVGTPTS